MMRFAALLVSVGIAANLPNAFERGPLWWAILGSVLCAANILIAATSTGVNRK